MLRSALFDPVKVAGYILSSRVVLAPINTGFARCGRPTPLLVNFHRERSGPEIAISTVGNVAVSSTAMPNSGTLLLQSLSDVPSFSRLARVISRAGSLPGIQLAFSPRGLGARRNWITKDKDGELKRLTLLLASMTDAHLAATLDAISTSSALAARAGFDFIQIHAAHGYLLSLLLNPLTNLRSGHFRLSGPWLSEFVNAVLESTHSRVVSVRLSLFSGLMDDALEEIAFTCEVSRLLAKLGVHILDYSAGFYTVDKRLIYPGIECGVLPYYTHVRELANEVNCLISLGGNVLDLRLVPALPDNIIVSVGRAFIADPQFAQKARQSRFDLIVSCRRSGWCHYFSRGRRMLECRVNSGLVRLT